jgi:hypothetical protein
VKHNLGYSPPVLDVLGFVASVEEEDDELSDVVWIDDAWRVCNEKSAIASKATSRAALEIVTVRRDKYEASGYWGDRPLMTSSGYWASGLG